MQHLIELRDYLASNIPQLTDENLKVLVMNGQLENGYLSYTVRIVLIDHRSDPILPLALVQQWLDSQKRPQSALSFETEVIDAGTFDLQMDIQMTDKLVVISGDYHLCPERSWSDFDGEFV